MHTMPPNTDRPINRAMVVGCAVSATRNHLKLHEPRRLKVLFCNIHAKTRKLWNELRQKKAQYVCEIPLLHQESINLSIQQFCDVARARFERCSSFETKQQFLAAHVERV